MKWLHFTNVPMNYVNGKLRGSEPWIDCEEMIADSGKRKGIKMMDMTISYVEEDDMVFLHFIGQKPTHGIRVGYVSDNEHTWY